MQYLSLAACYLFGAIPFGVIIGKIACGIDIRQYGSRNIGASNVLRTLGTGPALLVFFFDTVKGLGAVLLCTVVGLDPWWVVVGGLLSVVGHSFSVFLGFKGGKGVATSLGIIIGLDWLVALIALAIWGLLVVFTRYISVASIVATLSVPVQMLVWEARNVETAYKVLAVVAAMMIVLKHKSNFKRLVSGTEPRIGAKVSVEAESEGEK